MQRLQRVFVALSIIVAVFAITPTATFATPARNSVVVKTTIPSTMVAGSTYKVVIQMKNTGRYTWTSVSQYRLKGLGLDPFTKALSYWISRSERIAHDHSKTFTITMKAPSHAGSYVTDWRMYRGSLGFGAVVSRKVTVVPVTLTSIALTTPPAKLHYLTGDQLDLTGLVVTGTYNNGTKSVLPVTAGNVTGFNSNAAASAQVLTVTVGGKTVTFTIDVTEKKPVISAVHFASNSAKGADKAANGDIVTLTFTTDEPVTKLSNFKINGSNPDTFVSDGANHYTATHLVDSGDAITGNPATFQINVKNGLGIYSQTIEVTNDSSSVTIVDSKPVISAVHFASNSVRGTGVAEDGDILTLTFTTDEPVTKLGNFKINGSNPDTFTHIGNVYTATHLVDAGDPVTGVAATFQINVKNGAGVFSQTIEATNDGSSVLITLPIHAVHISSNSAKGANKAANGDIITLTFTTDEPVTKLGNFKINGSNPDSFTSVGNVYTVTHLVDAGDAITGTPATFQINVKNGAGVFSQTVEVTSDSSSVTIVDEKPAISAVHFASNSVRGPGVAEDGDVLTLTFTTDEPVTKLGNFKINGSNPDTFTHVGNVYTATHLVDAGDPVTGVAATFQINVKNAMNVFSQTIEATNDGSSVLITLPVRDVHISSNSAKGANKAANGDIITLTFTTDEPVTKLSNFKINGSNPDTFVSDGSNHYTATHLVDSGDAITGSPATFQINVKNGAGVFSQTIEVTSDSSSVTIVDEKPAISAVHISSDSGAGSSVAAIGDIITLVFTTDEPVTKLGNFKINGSNPDTFTHIGNVYKATHLVDAGDPVTGLPATFQINVKNGAGIFSQTIEVTNDSSFVTIVH